MSIIHRAFVNNLVIEASQLGVPTMNYGQLQRWTGHEQLRYKFEVGIDELLSTIDQFFEQFRQEEIADNDTEGFPELIAYKAAGWPNLDRLAKSDPSLLASLLKFNEYEVLSLLTVDESDHQELYLINSLEHVNFNTGKASFSGICFKVKRRVEKD